MRRAIRGHQTMPTTGQRRRQLGIGSPDEEGNQRSSDHAHHGPMKEAIRDRLTDGDAKDGMRAGRGFVRGGCARCPNATCLVNELEQPRRIVHAHLMREAISGHQWSSMAIRARAAQTNRARAPDEGGNQWSSVVLNGNQSSSSPDESCTRTCRIRWRLAQLGGTFQVREALGLGRESSSSRDAPCSRSSLIWNAHAPPKCHQGHSSEIAPP